VKLLASGRDGDVYEYGPGLVLRKTRDGRSIEREARTMQYAAEHGFPVPRVEEVRAGGTEIVMEHIDGPVMMDAMLRDPRLMTRGARILADLHDQLHEIRAPEWLDDMGDGGDRLVHMDFHPLNVMMSATRGPVVIDWPNARRGDPLSDVATTYVLLVGPQMPAPWIVRRAVQPVRVLMARSFAKRHRGRELTRRIADMAELKTLDSNMSPGEIASLERLARRMRAKAPG
jgi:aminoglycoside phosphotransferase (APT) family kinase protein